MAAADPVRALALASQARIPLVQTFLIRRIAALGTPEAIALLVDGLGRTSDLALRGAAGPSPGGDAGRLAEGRR
jgi:hypothetical protein